VRHGGRVGGPHGRRLYENGEQGERESGDRDRTPSAARRRRTGLGLGVGLPKPPEHIVHVVGTLGRCASNHRVHQACEVRRHRRRDVEEGGRLPFLLCPQQLTHGVPREGRRPCEQLEDGRAERVDVGARIDGLVQRLLRRHVARRTHARERRAVVGEVSHAEVEHLHEERRLAHHHQVLGLEVAMHDALRVHVDERFGDLLEQLDDLGGVQARPAGEPLPQVAPVHPLHHQVRGAAMRARVEHCDAVAIVDPPRRPDLVLEAPLQVRRQRTGEDLHDDVTGLRVHPRIPREVHVPGATPAERRQDAVAVGDQIADVRMERPAPLRALGPAMAALRLERLPGGRAAVADEGLNHRGTTPRTGRAPSTRGRSGRGGRRARRRPWTRSRDGSRASV